MPKTKALSKDKVKKEIAANPEFGAFLKRSGIYPKKVANIGMYINSHEEREKLKAVKEKTKPKKQGG